MREEYVKTLQNNLKKQIMIKKLRGAGVGSDVLFFLITKEIVDPKVTT